MSRARPRNGLSFSEYAKRHGVDRSTVSRWVRNGVISTAAGRIDPLIADAELSANRPLPRGRAAARSRAAPAEALAEIDAPRSADWLPAPAVLAALRTHAPALLARRLAHEGFATVTIAIAAIHVSQLLESAIAAAVIDDAAEPLSDGTIPPAGELDLPGAHYRATLERIETDPALDEIVWSEVQTLTNALGGGAANAVCPEGDQLHGS